MCSHHQQGCHALLKFWEILRPISELLTQNNTVSAELCNWCASAAKIACMSQRYIIVHGNKRVINEPPPTLLEHTLQPQLIYIPDFLFI